ncbi:DUF2871 domain-containing protein [Globicatella sp. PHS-GS-PNBC-21-1553]|uniref:DUF2871 domain-containing protein n=1 Tax=Globicatella sp. PHS-GS-PNBC-21-1553 TaxID=2885764 RepID=UPI00298ED888|nr:DUF2871 domain-containing protein [Globicatella sp. PHS-GS-PNBC-21-1553]WPC08978.1 DUF2871 domain-containing protein [Globicatella sp. PHS-GS-PNBC-21-1553]
MNFGESLFDIAYLVIVVALGVRLLLENKAGAKLFGLMAIILGVGDSFHLLPRVISHLSPGGFEAHTAALSWGQFVTSITMTLFYVLYFYFYRRQSGDDSSTKRWLVYGLAALRIILVALPQNQWGTAEGNYLFGILRNIPFLILGILLIYWSYQQRDKEGLKHMWLLILLSFAFYLPVVLLSDSIPAIGALMLPKTICYLLIVILGYRYFKGSFTAQDVLGMSFTFLVMGLVAGVFYREFTKMNNFVGDTRLSVLHTHTLVLGFVVLLIFYLLIRNYSSDRVLGIKKSYLIYISGLTFTLVMMVFIGIYQITAQGQDLINIKAIEGMSGLGHIILAVGMTKLLVKIYRLENIQIK